MIINNQESNIQVIGDITEFKSSIDPKNLEFITTLLSSNLYSAPERSFIREIVSNAWDAQVEAGTTDIPIIIKITESERTNYYSKDFTGHGDVTIRDFGTGLSPERFNEIYRNIGSSTKRESNDYHGAFGIGHLSGFSCSNTMYITSYYNGTCYEYIGIKDANTIVYTLVATTPTTEKNGLEVTLKNVSLDKYRKALHYIRFFPNIFIEDNNPIANENINETKIKKYNNFWVSSYVVYDKILLGNVLYPINSCELRLIEQNNSPLKRFLDNIQYTGIVLKFDIGELSVTPNRENIIYTKECIDKINKKIEAARAEINSIIENTAKEDSTDFLDYILRTDNSASFDFFTEKICKYNSYLYRIPEDKNINYTYKGKYLSKYRILLKNLTYNIAYCSKYFINDSRIYNVGKNVPYKYNKYFNLLNNNNYNILILKEDIKISKYLKEYIFENYNEYCIIIKPLDLKSIKSYIPPNMLATYDNKEDIDFILQELIDYIYSKGKVVDFNNDADFIKYKEECQKEAKLNKKNNPFKNKEIILNLYNNPYCAALRHSFTDFNEAIKFLKNLHKGIVFIDRDTPENTKEIIRKKGFKPIFVNKQLRKVLEEYSFSVELDWVLNKDPYLSYYKTIIEIFEEEYNIIEKLKTLRDIVSSNYLKDIDDIIPIIYSYNSSSTYGIYAKSKGKTDESLKKRLLKIKEFINEYDKAVDIIEDSGISLDYYHSSSKSKLIGLITKILVKNKSFMVNPTAYRCIKRNKLINTLCKN